MRTIEVPDATYERLVQESHSSGISVGELVSGLLASASRNARKDSGQDAGLSSQESDRLGPLRPFGREQLAEIEAIMARTSAPVGTVDEMTRKADSVYDDDLC